MLYFLFESSLGYALFKVNAWDKVATSTDKLQKDIQDYQSFKKIASLEANYLFQGHGVAYESLNQLKNGELPEDLADFLRTNLPSAKKTAFQLASQDKVLATKINEQLKVKCVSGEAYNEIFRGIRAHLSAFLSGEDGELIRAHYQG
jgi:hypothetical protein